MKNEELVIGSIVRKKLNRHYKDKIIKNALEDVVNECMKEIYPYYSEQTSITAEQLITKTELWEEIDRETHYWLSKYQDKSIN